MFCERGAFEKNMKNPSNQDPIFLANAFCGSKFLFYGL